MIKNAGAGEYTLFSTEMGWMGLACTQRGIFASVLPQKIKNEAKLQLLAKLPFEPRQSHDAFSSLESLLHSYFQGEKVDLQCNIDWSWATPFQEKVLKLVVSIPRGNFLSYGNVAQFIGSPKAARAVGGALVSNMIPIIIPCHRVIRENGQLGGFTGAELEFKARLLCLEGVEITKTKNADAMASAINRNAFFIS